MAQFTTIQRHSLDGYQASNRKRCPNLGLRAVQVYGTARIYFGTKSEEFGDFLTQQLSDLSQYAETSIMGYGSGAKSQPWQVSDAPTPYIDIMKKNIIGIEIEIMSMGGRFKMSQEKPKGDRAGVIKGFQNMGTAVGTQIAGIVQQRAMEFDAAKEEKQRP